MRRIAAALALLLLPAGAFGQDDVRVRAGFTQPRIPIGATTTLFVEVETRGDAPDEIRVPDLPRGLIIVGTSDYTHTQLTIPAGRSRVTRREVAIVARAPGVYEVPAVIVRAGGTAYRTAPLQLVVSGVPAASTAGGRSELRIRIQPDSVFIGEQLLLQAEVTFAEDFRSRQGRAATFEPPAASGFWVQDLPDPVTINLRVAEGRTVESQTYSRAYFPLAAGTFVIPPARLHYEVRRGFGYPPEARELTSDSVTVTVLPIPTDGRPQLYNGAVGQLSMAAALSTPRVAAGQAAVLTVTLAGTGNVKGLPAPELPDLDGVELFPPTQQSRVEVDGFQVGGAKQFQWVLVPDAPGTLTVPPVEYATFDPERRTFVTLRTDTLRLQVAPAVNAAASDTALRPMRTTPATPGLEWVGSPWFVAAQILPLLGLVLLGRRRSRLREAPPHATHLARARERLGQLRQRTPDLEWAGSIEKVVCDVVHRVTGVSAEDPAGIQRAGFSCTAAAVTPALTALRSARYAPDAVIEAQPMLTAAETVIAALEVDSRTDAGSTAAGATVVALMLALAAPVAAQDEFAVGVTRMAAGEPAAAAAAFAEWTAERPHDTNAWLNYGLASARAGDPGRAAWAWLRGLRTAPRDADLLHNLERIGAAAAARTMRPPDRLQVRERRLVAAAAWWILLGGAMVLIASRSAPLRRGAAALATLCAGVIAATLVVGVLQAAAPLRVVPLGQGTAMLAGPAIREDTVAVLRPGELGEVVQRRADWLLVRDRTGAEGWVARRAMASP